MDGAFNCLPGVVGSMCTEPADLISVGSQSASHKCSRASHLDESGRLDVMTVVMTAQESKQTCAFNLEGNKSVVKLTLARVITYPQLLAAQLTLLG